jgi:putative tryptophan/tyrosine transport system substrate-binding protein
VRRRDFITLIGGAAAWPLAARGQQTGRVRRIGVLMASPVTDARYQSLVAAFRQRLQELGWDERSNIQIDYRWAAEDAESIRAYARELVGLRPDVILARSSPEIAALRDETHTIPIVFAHATDPVASGFVPNLAHPGGNITGFMNFEYPMGGKWLEMLKEIAPGVMRVAVINNPDNVSSPGYLRVMETVAQSLGVQLTDARVRDSSEIERTIDGFAREPNGGMIVLPDFVFVGHRGATVTLATAARNKLPAVYPFPLFVAGGGLMSYAAELTDLYRRAGAYVDRILRGTKPGDLPVQVPERYELVINLKTAKALALTVPPTLLARADEGIE